MIYLVNVYRIIELYQNIASFSLKLFMHLIEDHIKELKEACIKFQVAELYAFGSVLTNNFRRDSDLDFIVTIDETDPLECAEYYFQLKFALEKIFGRKIDLLEQKSIRNPLFKDLVDHKKRLVYARGNKGLA